MKIIFFDQNCGLCHFWVRTLMRLDRGEKLKFAPLFGETYQKLIPESFSINDSVIYYNNHKIYTHSDAIIHGLSDMNLFFKLFLISKIIPRILRDSLYMKVSENRQSLSCYFQKENNSKFLP